MKYQRWWFLGGLCFMSFVGWVLFPYVLYERIEQPLQFSHKVHIESAGMTCDACHGLSEEGRFLGIPPLTKCAECHTDIIGSSPHEKLFVEEYVKKNREVPWLIYSKQPQNVYFSHTSHIKLAKLNCEDCHGHHGTTDSLRIYERNKISGYGRDIWGRSIVRLKSSPWDGMKMDDCADCHRKRGVPNTCLKCHK